MRLLLALLIAVTPVGVLLAAAPERYVILDADGGKAGDIEVTPRGSGLEIVWDSKNNGRGTETREQLELDAAGLPKSWRIDTKTDLGGTGASSGATARVHAFLAERRGLRSWSGRGFPRLSALRYAG